MAPAALKLSRIEPYLLSFSVGSIGHGAAITSQGAHHFVVFVFEDVAKPDVAAGVSLAADDDAGDHGGIGADRILPSRFAWVGGMDGPR
jgi:hypothetical protein